MSTEKEEPRQDPCVPSPCGPNSQCRATQDRAQCTCIPGMFGAPPNCRPECTINQDCPSNRACFGQKCQDPCIGSCGFNALCNVKNHQPICSCFEGYDGDPYSGCNAKQGKCRVHSQYLSILRFQILRLFPVRNVLSSSNRDLSSLFSLSLWCKCALY